jgi:hypothetical protein
MRNLIMKKATREFLKARSGTFLVQVTKVNFAGALPNFCGVNASNFCKTDPKYSLVSGWMVGDDCGQNGTALIAHYFVLDNSTSKYYDPTPSHPADNQTYEYVVDMDILDYYMQNISTLQAQGISLLHSFRILNGPIFQIVSSNQQFINVNDLDTKSLYHYRSIY